MHGAADLIIVQQFAGTDGQSRAAAGSQMLNMVTTVITGLTMGLTVFGEEVIGSAEREEAGQSVGCGIVIFAVVAILVTDAVVPFTHQLAV